MGGIFSSRRSYYVINKQGGFERYKRLGRKEGECEFLIPADQSPSYNDTKHTKMSSSDIAKLFSTEDTDHVVHIDVSMIEQIASIIIEKGGDYKRMDKCEDCSTCCKITFSTIQTMYPAFPEIIPSAPPIQDEGCSLKITKDEFSKINFNEVSVFHLDASDIDIVYGVDKNIRFNSVGDCKHGCIVMECRPALVDVSH